MTEEDEERRKKNTKEKKTLQNFSLYLLVI
jgi:hypothetical protein